VIFLEFLAGRLDVRAGGGGGGASESELERSSLSSSLEAFLFVFFLAGAFFRGAAAFLPPLARPLPFTTFIGGSMSSSSEEAGTT